MSTRTVALELTLPQLRLLSAALGMDNAIPAVRFRVFDSAEGLIDLAYEVAQDAPDGPVTVTLAADEIEALVRALASSADYLTDEDPELFSRTLARLDAWERQLRVVLLG